MLKTKTKRTIKRQIDTGFKLTITAELTPDEEEGGYVVYCPELDIYTQGETIEECIENLQEAASGYIKVQDLRSCPGIAK